MRRRLVAVGLPAAVVVCLAIGILYGARDAPGTGLTPRSSGGIALGHVSWAKWYPDLESLVNGHSTVIVGEVQASDMETPREGFTHHTVKVLQVVKGDLEPGDIITVSQTGGIHIFQTGKKTYYELEDDPLMRPGEKSLLFLNGPTTQEIVSDKVVYLGTSPQTRFIIDRGRVFWMGDVFKDRRIPRISNELMWMNGRRLDTVLTRLKEIAS